MIEVRALDAYSKLDKVVAQLTTVSIGLSSNFNADRVLKGTVNYTYIPVGAVKKIVSFKLDGVEIGTQIVNSSNEQQTFPITGLTHGSHNVQLRADYNITDTNGLVIATVYSNIIYLDIAVVDDDNTDPVFSCRFDYEDGESLISGTPVVNAK